MKEREPTGHASTAMHPTEERLSDYADGSIDPVGRADLERHLASCAACRQTVDDLRAVLQATRTLELREPPVRAWSRIERAIRLEAESRHSTQNAQSSQNRDGSGAKESRRVQRVLRSTPWLPWLAAAAALVLATFVGVRYAPGRGGDRSTSSPPSAGATIAGGTSADSAQIEAELREAEAHYENAIKGLEQIANAEQSALDPHTAATLQKNLAVIDQAISESRAAVKSQPSSEPAQQSLVENFKAKIGLLQDTVALINEMRKGNEAGAARIVSGLRQKGN
jgi:anti-sigma factor ChrR (cupin superfamily)